MRNEGRRIGTSILNAEISILISEFGPAKRDREVAVLVNERKGAWNYEVQFDAKGLASGMYLYRLSAGSFVSTRKCVLVK